MGLKKLIARTAKHERRKRDDKAEYAELEQVTDDKLRRSVGSLVTDLRMVDSDYLRFVKKHSRFGKDGGKSEYNKQMLEKARKERVRAQIGRYQEAMRDGVSGMAVARVVGHVAINAIFNKQFREDFLDEFRKPIERTAERLAKAGGQASLSGKMMRSSVHVPFDARSAALTELAQTMKFNEDMRKTKDPVKREWLIKHYGESLNALYDWAKEDGVPADSIRRMRNVMLDKDSRSSNPKFAHLYEGMEFMERTSERTEVFAHLDEATFVWEGDFKDSRTGKKFEMLVKTPAYGEELTVKVDKNIDLGIEAYSDPKAIIDETVEIAKMEAEGYDFSEPVEELETEPVEVSSETKHVGIDFSTSFEELEETVKQKPEPSLEIGTWADVAREVVRRRVPEVIAHDIVAQRYSPIIEKATWERVVEELSNQAEKPAPHINGKYVHNGNGYTTNEHLQRQAEFQLVNDAFKGHLSKRLAMTSEMINTENDGYNRLELDTNKMDVNVSYVTRERVRRQERLINFEETKEELAKIAAKTPSLTDDQLLAKLELAQAEAGSGASLAEDMKDFQIGN